MVNKKKYTQTTTYWQDIKKSISVVDQNFLSRKTISKLVVFTSKIILKNCTRQPNLCRGCIEHSKSWSKASHVESFVDGHFIWYSCDGGCSDYWIIFKTLKGSFIYYVFKIFQKTNIFTTWYTYACVILIGSNDIIPSKQRNLNVKDVAQRIIDIGLYCRECGVKDKIISYILVKRNFHLTRIIR